MSFTQTTTYRSPGLAFDTISGVTVPGSPNPIFIPMILTTAGPPTRNPKTNVVQFIPFDDGDTNTGGVMFGTPSTNTNQYFGGNTQFEAPRELPKITLEGTIDTPMTLTSSTGESGRQLYLPATMAGSYHITYPELIAMTMEGRAGSTYAKINPRWYRDPFGRVYGDFANNGSVPRPRIIAFTSNYMEGTPQRMQFTMTLKVVL